jgi:hypothetical protein
MAGKPWSDEAKAAHRDRITKSHEKRKEMYGPTGHSPDAYISENTKKWIPTLYHFLLEIHQCIEDPEYFEAWKEANPTHNAQIRDGIFFFNKSSKFVRQAVLSPSSSGKSCSSASNRVVTR